MAADRADDPVARLDDDAVPVLRDIAADVLARALKPGQNLTVRFDGAPLALALPALAGPIVARVDGRRSVGAIRADLQRTVDPHLSDSAFAAAFAATYEVLCGINRLLLTRP